ncbi:MAG: hypothetical protein D6715_08345 [Calditrichaeota bacterium]|nr:MAG: hypothetical protein D6715_08345 [Calditrichota bacterium]
MNGRKPNKQTKQNKQEEKPENIAGMMPVYLEELTITNELAKKKEEETGGEFKEILTELAALAFALIAGGKLVKFIAMQFCDEACKNELKKR